MDLAFGENIESARAGKVFAVLATRKHTGNGVGGDGNVAALVLQSRLLGAATKRQRRGLADGTDGLALVAAVSTVNTTSAPLDVGLILLLIFQLVSFQKYTS